MEGHVTKRMPGDAVQTEETGSPPLSGIFLQADPIAAVLKAVKCQKAGVLNIL